MCCSLSVDNELWEDSPCGLFYIIIYDNLLYITIYYLLMLLFAIIYILL